MGDASDETDARLEAKLPDLALDGGSALAVTDDDEERLFGKLGPAESLDERQYVLRLVRSAIPSWSGEAAEAQDDGRVLGQVEATARFLLGNLVPDLGGHSQDGQLGRIGAEPFQLVNHLRTHHGDLVCPGQRPP